MACPHTMRATDASGVTRCCDCGKALKMPPRKAAPHSSPDRTHGDGR